MMGGIKEFFKDKSIFITGGTGLVGQVLIEKLLRSCEVHKIYVLLRAKNGNTWRERLNKMLKDEVTTIMQFIESSRVHVERAIP